MCFAKMSSVSSNTFNKHAILKLPTCFDNTLCFFIYISLPSPAFFFSSRPIPVNCAGY